MHLPPCVHKATSLVAAWIVAVATLEGAPANPPASPLPPLTIALFDFQTSDSALEKPCSAVSAFLYVHLSDIPTVLLVERSDVEKVLAEQSFGASGLVSAESAAQLGQMLGVKVIVTGRMLKTGGQITIMAKVIGTETGRVFTTEAWVPSTEDSLDSASAELAKKIADLIKVESANLLATVETDAQRLDRLHALIEGKTLPPVAIKFTEQNLTRTVADPAVQTELTKLLKELGFEVVTPKEAATRKDAVTVSGEAFSELAMRRDNFVSCRCRIELSVKAANGSLVLTDREMDIAVDLAADAAGEKALQGAALKLADRLVPRLAAIRSPLVAGPNQLQPSTAF
jgi:TolB-like protein